jgi:hypothetical protein
MTSGSCNICGQVLTTPDAPAHILEAGDRQQFEAGLLIEHAKLHVAQAHGELFLMSQQGIGTFQLLINHFVGILCSKIVQSQDPAFLEATKRLRDTVLLMLLGRLEFSRVTLASDQGIAGLTSPSGHR